jgi:hypothetical protein
MDLLASLGLGTALPEQATRLTCHPGIIRLLDGGDDKEEENNVRLGFHQCLNCGIQLKNVVSSSPSSGASNKNKNAITATAAAAAVATTTTTKVGVACQGCRRVLYCSVKCRTDDATPTNNNNSTDEEADTGSYGHSPIICSLLRLCNDDEDAEEEELRDIHNCNKNKRHNNTERKEAAIYRNQTERESYPATLFNILSEGPTWFVEAMTRKARQTVDVKSPIRSPVPVTFTKNNNSRRGKRDRTTAFGGNSSSNEESQKQQKSSVTTIEIVLHIVGATTESELWGWDGTSSSASSNSVDVLDAYTEASTNLISYLEELLQVPSITLRCIFIGPNCGTSSRNGSATKIPIMTAMNDDTSNLSMKNKSSSNNTTSPMLIIETQCCNYGNNTDKELVLPPPDVIIFFNPGFSCPDYDWSSALSYASSYSLYDKLGGGPIPFLVTTNTELEGYADIKVLLDGGHININTVSRDILEAIDYPIGNRNISNKSKQYDDEFEEQVIFGMNPYVGLRVRQSGTMGNDLFVKNRWIICGLFQKMSSIRPNTATPPTHKRNKSITDSRNKDDDDDDIGEEKSRKRQRNENDVGGGDKNAKKKNPALI